MMLVTGHHVFGVDVLIAPMPDQTEMPCYFDFWNVKQASGTIETLFWYRQRRWLLVCIVDAIAVVDVFLYSLFLNPHDPVWDIIVHFGHLLHENVELDEKLWIRLWSLAEVTKATTPLVDGIEEPLFWVFNKDVALDSSTTISTTTTTIIIVVVVFLTSP